VGELLTVARAKVSAVVERMNWTVPSWEQEQLSLALTAITKSQKRVRADTERYERLLSGVEFLWRMRRHDVAADQFYRTRLRELLDDAEERHDE
jgi:hypothetical protein